MPSGNTLLTIQQGNEGTFVSWLKDLGLGDFIRHYSLPELVEWGWLVPQSRIVFPVDYFLAWKNFPYTETYSQNFKIENLLWDSSWEVDDQESLWFLHPFFRPDDIYFDRLQLGKYENKIPAVPAAFNHSNDYIIIPYVDYYFHWQAYALIDVIRTADCISPILNTPNVEEQAQGIVRIVERVKNNNPTDILTLDRRWGGLAEPMTWLSHYRSFRNALSENTNKTLKREGAKQLANYLGISAAILESAIKEKLLVLAQNWHWDNEHYCVWTLRAWPYLQSDIVNALEWLCYLNEKSFRDNFKLLVDPCIDQREYPQLHKMLPFEFFEDRQYFLNYVPHYQATYKNMLPTEERLKQLVDDLQSNNYPFGSFLRAFRQLHEQLVYNPKQKGSLDFREYRPLDYYSLLAIRAEACLQYELEKNGLLGNVNNQGLEGYVIEIAKQKNIPQRVIECFKDKVKTLTVLRERPAEPINEIINIHFRNWDKKDTHLLQAFLCCLLARNYFAHHTYLDKKLLRNKESGFMLAGILITVLTLLGSE